MEQNSIETKENCQSASNFDVEGNQVQTEDMSTDDTTIINKALDNPENDQKKTIPKHSAEEISGIRTGDTLLSSHEPELTDEELITDEATNENKDSHEDKIKSSQSHAKRRKIKGKKFKKHKKRKLDASMGKGNQLIGIDDKDPPLTTQEVSDNQKELTSSVKRERRRKKHSRNDKETLETSKVEVELKFLSEAMSGLIENFNNFQEFAKSKLAANDENWRQLKNVKTSTQTTPLDLNDIRRPPAVGFTRVDDNMIHLGRGVWLSRATYDNDVYTAGSSPVKKFSDMA